MAHELRELIVQGVHILCWILISAYLLVAFLDPVTMNNENQDTLRYAFWVSFGYLLVNAWISNVAEIISDFLLKFEVKKR